MSHLSHVLQFNVIFCVIEFLYGFQGYGFKYRDSAGIGVPKYQFCKSNNVSEWVLLEYLQFNVIFCVIEILYGFQGYNRKYRAFLRGSGYLNVSFVKFKSKQVGFIRISNSTRFL